MLFFLGFIAGLVLATFVAVALAYFKRPIISTLTMAEANLVNAGPRLRGSIYIPRDDAEVARDRIVAENREKGLDTNIDELR